MTSPSPLALGTPFSLGDPSVLHTARGDRLALGVNFLPSATALGAVSGIVHGPAGSMGELTLVSDAVLRTNPFVAVLQGTHNTRQGQYVIPNEQQRDLAVVAKDASLQRRSLLVLRVADSQEAGVAASPTTNGAWLERLDGALAASNPALPDLPANSLALGELLVPSVASGAPVQLTPYNPRTGARHGILPVIDDESTLPGHGRAPGVYVGQYRDRKGPERWHGNDWRPAGVTDSPMVRARRNSGATGRYRIVPSTWTPIPMQTADVDTGHDMWTFTQNQFDVFCRRDGIYHVSAGGALEVTPPAGKRLVARIMRYNTAGQWVAAGIGNVTHLGGSFEPSVSASGLMRMVVGERIRLDLFHDIAAPDWYTPGNAEFAPTYIEAQWLRPLP